ncbi:MAG: YgjV family protein [Lachnospiraceae bacterium]|nr:YgjV family protein [Lachnospiraceae bacterium]
MIIVIANIIDFIAAMVQIWSGTIKKKQHLLLAQTVQMGLQTVSMSMLGGISGAIGNVLSCIRNLVCYKEWLNWPLKILFIAAQFGLTWKFNVQGALGWLPFWVCAIYIVFMDIKDHVHFKILSTISYLPWVVYFFMIQSYTGSLFALITTITSGWTLVKMIRNGGVNEEVLG